MRDRVRTACLYQMKGRVVLLRNGRCDNTTRCALNLIATPHFRVGAHKLHSASEGLVVIKKYLNCILRKIRYTQLCLDNPVKNSISQVTLPNGNVFKIRTKLCSSISKHTLTFEKTSFLSSIHHACYPVPRPPLIWGYEQYPNAFHVDCS